MIVAHDPERQTAKTAITAGPGKGLDPDQDPDVPGPDLVLVTNHQEVTNRRKSPERRIDQDHVADHVNTTGQEPAIAHRAITLALDRAVDRETGTIKGLRNDLRGAGLGVGLDIEQGHRRDRTPGPAQGHRRGGGHAAGRARGTNTAAGHPATPGKTARKRVRLRKRVQTLSP